MDKQTSTKSFAETVRDILGKDVNEAKIKPVKQDELEEKHVYYMNKNKQIKKQKVNQVRKDGSIELDNGAILDTSDKVDSKSEIKQYKDYYLEEKTLDKDVNEAKIKPFKQLKKGDVLSMGKEKAKVVATGSFKSLMKYDESGAAAEGLDSGDIKANEDAVAVDIGGETAVYPYEDMSMYFESKKMKKEEEDSEKDSEEEMEESKKYKKEEEDSEDDSEDDSEEEMEESKKMKKEEDDSEDDSEEEMEESKKMKKEEDDSEEEEDVEEESSCDSKKMKKEEDDSEEDSEEEMDESKKMKKEEEDSEEETDDSEEEMEESKKYKKEEEDSDEDDDDDDEEDDSEELSEKYSDKDSVSDIISKEGSRAQLKISAQIRKMAKKKDVYFDGMDLVVGDTTALKGALDKKKKYTMADLAKAAEAIKESAELSEKYSDKDSVSDIISKEGSRAQLKISAQIRKMSKKKDVYFDGMDLVVGDTTALKGALNKKNSYIMADLAKAAKDVKESYSENTSKELVDKIFTKENTHATDSITDLFASDDTLSEEFKGKAAIIFEAAVSEKVESVKEEYQKQIQESVEENYQAMIEKVDNYLSYVIESWMEENEETVDSRLRTEISESFIESIKEAFEKHYIEMPEGRLDLYDDLSQKAEKLEEQSKIQDNQISELNEQIETLKREKIIREASEGLYDTQVAKLKKLTENLEFLDEDNFVKKVSIIKETYFSGKDDDNGTSELNENTEYRTRVEEDDDVDTNSAMGKYVAAISKHMNKK